MSEVITIPKSLFDEMSRKQKEAVDAAYERGRREAVESFRPEIAKEIGEKAIQNLTFYDGYKQGVEFATGSVMHRFYPAVGLALHELYSFGENRIVKVLDMAHKLAEESIDGKDLENRLKEQTGLELMRQDELDLPDNPEEW